jgi:hypothetical protein
MEWGKERESKRWRRGERASESERLCVYEYVGVRECV